MHKKFQNSIIVFNENKGKVLAGIGVDDFFEWNKDSSFECFDLFLNTHKKDYLVGFMSYDFKNHIECLTSKNQDELNFPDLLFWVPSILVQMTKTNITFLKGSNNTIFINKLKDLQRNLFTDEIPEFNIDLKERTSKEDYITNLNHLINEIKLGNIYEINYCQEFYSNNIHIDPLKLYKAINSVTNAPYSCFFSFADYHLASGSPELFLRKEKNNLITKPIKGTRKRGKTITEDKHLINELKNDSKEQSENIMIVDLVRNDLSKIAEKKSVTVDELCEIYTFQTVHQMISSVSAKINNKVTFSEILQAMFPMGSMTGAPKVNAMKLAEKFEDFKRNIYSGSVGIIYPNGNFDFNVVIRSVAYNSKNKYLSCGVGSAITIESNPYKEYDECNIKIKSIKKVLNSNDFPKSKF